MGGKLVHTGVFKAAATAVMALALAGCVAKYQPWSFGVMGGYTSDEIEPGLWRITGRTTEHNYSGEALDMAFYRAAEIATASGFSHFEVISGSERMLQLGYSATGGSSPMGERSEIFVRFPPATEPVVDCLSPKMDQCQYHNAAAILGALGSRMGIGREPQL